MREFKTLQDGGSFRRIVRRGIDLVSLLREDAGRPNRPIQDDVLKSGISDAMGFTSGNGFNHFSDETVRSRNRPRSNIAAVWTRAEIKIDLAAGRRRNRRAAARIENLDKIGANPFRDDCFGDG